MDVEALYAQHHLTVLRFLLRRTNGDDELAEDLSQEVWIKVLRAWPTYVDRGTPVAAWLYRIARNAVIDHAREHRSPPTLSADLVTGLAATTSDAGTEGQVNELEVLRLVEALTTGQRAVIRARFLMGLSVRETSEETGASEGAVKKTQARALMALRRRMEAA